MPDNYPYWRGIDGGREGLWTNRAQWKTVLEIIDRHPGEHVYEESSPIYEELEAAYPDDSWRTYTEGSFRPLFRDYPNAWTRTNTLDISDGTFKLTNLGKRIVGCTEDPIEAIIPAIARHQESQDAAKPFTILSKVFLKYPSRSLNLEELYWGVVVGFRPESDDINSIFDGLNSSEAIADTPKRRLKAILSLMESVGAIASDKTTSSWKAWGLSTLKRIVVIGDASDEPSQDVEFDAERQKDLASLVRDYESALTSAGVRPAVNFAFRFVNSLISKKFLILTGMSGSGKTLLARIFAKWISTEEDQFAVVPVGANWTSSEFVLGYPDGLDSSRYVRTRPLDLILSALERPTKPHFLILDEMNLSHVERYFADILSAIESPEESIFLHGDSEDRGDVPPNIREFPQNLFVIGTVNVDETTYMFSPKVLDRANVIEFRTTVSDLESFVDQSTALDMSKIPGGGSRYGQTFCDVAAVGIDPSKLLCKADREIVKSELKLIFSVLSRHGWEFGYRTVKDILRFITLGKPVFMNIAGTTEEEAMKFLLDTSVLQKLLPRLNGSRKNLQQNLDELIRVLNYTHVWGINGLENADDALSASANAFDPDLEVVSNCFPIATAKLLRMRRRLVSNGFTSFAEA